MFGVTKKNHDSSGHRVKNGAGLNDLVNKNCLYPGGSHKNRGIIMGEIRLIISDIISLTSLKYPPISRPPSTHLIVPLCCWHILNEEKNVLKIFLLLQILFPPTEKGGAHIEVEFVESVRL